MERPSITFDGLNSADDFGAVINRIQRTPGQKKRAMETVPYSSHAIDMSRAPGRYSYTERTDTYTFLVKGKAPKELEDKISAMINWLSEAPCGILRDSTLPDRYLVESSCTSTSVKYINERTALLTAGFKSYPYMISDYIRAAFYPATGTSTEHTYELTFGNNIIPYFSTSAACKIQVGDVWYELAAGTKRLQITDIIFTRGSNSFNLMGAGELTIECFEEVL